MSNIKTGDEKEENEQGIELPIYGSETGSLYFQNIDDFSEWIASQMKAWEWISPTEGQKSQVRNGVCQPYAYAKGQLDLAKGKMANTTEYDRHIESAINYLKTASDNDKLILQSSPKGQYLLGLKEAQPEVAVFALAVFLNIPNINFTSNPAVRGSWLAMAFEQGVCNESFESYRGAFEELNRDFRGHIEPSKKELDGLRENYATIAKDIDSLASDFSDRNSEQLKKLQDSFEAAILHGKNDLKELDETYNKHMALKAPVDYWKNMAEFSYIQAAVLFVIFVVFVVCSWGFLSEKISEVLSVSKDDFHYGKASFLLFISFAGFWIVRLVFQIIVSRLHIASEASEKAVMTQAYLSLVKGKKIEAHESEIVFRNIFRSSGSGLVRDDNSHPAMEIINKVLKRD